MMTTRKDSDEFYVIELCDEILGARAARQHTFDFLRGDGTPGRRLPVDAYYPELNLVIEYRERQHSESVAFFDKKKTVSGVSRGEQRRIYDQRRRDILPKHGIRLVEISYADLKHDSRKRLVRDRQNDLNVIRKLLQAYNTNKQNSDKVTTTESKANTSKDVTQTWIYRVYNSKYGCLLPFIGIPTILILSLLLSGYMSICVFNLEEYAYIIMCATLFITSFICYYCTTKMDERIDEKKKQHRIKNYTYSGPAMPPVCCPVCGSLNIGLIDNYGGYGCMDCGLKWQQGY